jgi:DNA-directed RNA polymerase specialized sigma24 family protein
MTLADWLRAPEEASPERQCCYSERARLIWELAECILTSRQYKALVLRYREDLTLEQTGRLMGIGVPAVHGLEERAIARLRAGLQVLGIRDSHSI